MTVQACRNSLLDLWQSRAIQRSAAPGLVMDRYPEMAVPNNDKSKGTIIDIVMQTAKNCQKIYSAAFDRWQNSFKSQSCSRTMTLQTSGRLITGLGGDSVLETGIRLHHTYGIPVIPGSSLKGLAAHYCNDVWGNTQAGGNAEFKRTGTYYQVLFGDTTQGGLVVFHDAWILPDSIQHAFKRDIMTPHHSGYYSGNEFPTDFDDPVPVAFLSVSGQFLIALSIDTGCDQLAETDDACKWLDLGIKLLSEALEYRGAGGKTSSGYGRLVSPNAVKEKTPDDSKGTRVTQKKPTINIKPGDCIEVELIPDPRGKGRQCFLAANGFKGFVTDKQLVPDIEIGGKTRLKVLSILSAQKGINFKIDPSC